MFISAAMSMILPFLSTVAKKINLIVVKQYTPFICTGANPPELRQNKKQESPLQMKNQSQLIERLEGGF